MENINTFIASDVHLGSEVSRSDVLLKELKKYSFKRLILLGDIFEDLNFTRLKNKHWEFLSYIRKLSNEKKTVEVVWIAGNHDELLIDVMDHLLVISISKEYIWEYNSQKYLAIHGHQFDSFIVNNKLLSDFATIFYKFFQRIDKKNHKFSRAIKRMSKAWLRVSEEIAQKALVYGKTKGVDYVFCGHSHQVFKRREGGITYMNTGCWTDIPSHYIIIDESGVITTKEVK
jgi:UDP-2,3-diacylglucosamine pyrophosphatase LpxH